MSDGSGATTSVTAGALLEGDDASLVRALSLRERFRNGVVFDDGRLPGYAFTEHEPLEGGTALVFRLTTAGSPDREHRALKVFFRSPHATPDAAARWAREYENLRLLQDVAGVPRVYERGTIDGFAAIVMEFVEGVTLATRLSESDWDPSNPAFNPSARFQEAQRLVVAMLQILQQIQHELCDRGITDGCHRDLKPSNVIIAPTSSAVRPRIKILDFGESSFKSTTGWEGYTQQFAAPEQRLPRLGPVGPWSDQFAVGAILQEMLHRVDSNQSGQAASPAASVSHQMRAARDAAQRMTSRQASDRFDTFAEAAHAIENPRRLRIAVSSWVLFAGLAAGIFIGWLSARALRTPPQPHSPITRGDVIRLSEMEPGDAWRLRAAILGQVTISIPWAQVPPGSEGKQLVVRFIDARGAVGTLSATVKPDNSLSFLGHSIVQWKPHDPFTVEILERHHGSETAIYSETSYAELSLPGELKCIRAKSASVLSGKLEFKDGYAFDFEVAVPAP